MGNDAIEQLRRAQNALNAAGMNANGIEAGIYEIERLRAGIRTYLDGTTKLAGDTLTEIFENGKRLDVLRAVLGEKGKADGD